MQQVERIPITTRAQWLELRTRDITASDVPSVCGEGLFGSPASVWARKRGLVQPDEENDAMRRGRWGEAAVVEALADERPTWRLRRAKIYLRDASARLGATPDCVAIDPDREGLGIIQAKVISRNAFEEHWLQNEGDDPHDLEAPAQAPMAYRLQTLTEAHLADAAWADIAALVVDQWRWTLRLFPVGRHMDAESRIRVHVADFWKNYLDPGIQPPIDVRRDSELVKQLYPEDDGSSIDLTDSSSLGLVDQLAVVKATIKQADARKTEIETDLRGRMGAHTFGHLADGRWLTNKLQSRKAYVADVAATSYRVLRVSKKRNP